LLERSIVDRMVYAGERLVYEGAPILQPPLQQDQTCRRPVPTDGELMDSRRACPDLDLIEKSRLHELKLKSAYPLKGEAAKKRREFEERQAQALATRTGMSLRAAQEQVARQCDGILLPDILLPFDDEDFQGCTVAGVLADPARFEGATLADPLEGIPYGRCVAQILRRPDGTPWVHSFAHGRTDYVMKHNAASGQAAIDAAPDADAVKVLIEMIPNADLAPDEQTRLRKYAAERAGIGLRDVNSILKAVQKQVEAKRKQEAKERKKRERTDPRPQVPRPGVTDEYKPIMAILNKAICASRGAAPASS
jgi:hypothetical protein